MKAKLLLGFVVASCITLITMDLPEVVRALMIGYLLCYWINLRLNRR